MARRIPNPARAALGTISLLVAAGCSLDVKIPTPEAFTLRESLVAHAIAEVDEWGLEGTVTLPKGTYRVPFEEERGITIKLRRATKLTVKLQAEMQPYEKIAGGYRVRPWFNQFEIKASQPIAVGVGGQELLKIEYITESEGRLEAEVRLHLANVIGYAISTYVLREDLSAETRKAIPKLPVGAVSVKKLRGVYLPESVVKAAGKSIGLGGGATFEIHDVHVDPAGTATASVHFTAGNVNITPPAAETAVKLTAGEAAIDIRGTVFIKDREIRLSTPKSGVNVAFESLELYEDGKATWEARSGQLVSEVGSLTLSRSRQLSNVSGRAQLLLDELVAKGSTSFVLSELSPLAIDVASGQEGLTFKFANQDPVIVIARDIALSKGKGIAIESAELTIPPFSVERLADLRVSVDTLVLNAGPVLYGTNTPDGTLKLVPGDALTLTMASPLVIGVGASNKNISFSTTADLRSLAISGPKIPGITLENIGLELKGSDEGLVGALRFNGALTNVNGRRIDSLAANARVDVPNLAFTFTPSEGLRIDELRVVASVPGNQVEERVRSALAAPTEPKYGGVSGRDLTRWLSAFTVKDTRTRTNIYGVNLQSLEFKGASARANVAGAIRVELQAEVLTTKMVMKEVLKWRPCIRKNRWGIPVPTNCKRPIKTKVPVTHHKWKRAVAATVKAGLKVRVRFNASVGKPLSELGFSPNVKVTGVDFKDVPGFLDKNFLSPFAYLFITKKDLDPVVVFRGDLPAGVNEILKSLVLTSCDVRSKGSDVILDVSAALRARQ